MYWSHTLLQLLSDFRLIRCNRMGRLKWLQVKFCMDIKHYWLAQNQTIQKCFIFKSITCLHSFYNLIVQRWVVWDPWTLLGLFIFISLLHLCVWCIPELIKMQLWRAKAAFWDDNNKNSLRATIVICRWVIMSGFVQSTTVTHLDLPNVKLHITD